MTPIGNALNAFTGSYDGQGYRIENFVINRPSELNIGLFGVIEGGEIVNLFVNNATISGSDNIGALVGAIYSGSTINSCSSSNSIVSAGSGYAGGLIGYTSVTSSISCCFSSNAVNVVEGTAGGLVGRNTGSI